MAKYEYHKVSKADKYFRKALYEAYGHLCVYCKDMVFPKNMQVDHIYAEHAVKSDDVELNAYLDGLRQDDFDTEKPNYIENFALSCAGCNYEKSNKNYDADYFRHYHRIAKEKTPKILELMEKYKNGKPGDIEEFRPENADVKCYTTMPERVNETQVICREGDLENVEALINKYGTVHLYGFGGVGKTSLAKLLFHRIKREYDETAWIPYYRTLKDSVLKNVQLFEEIQDTEERWDKIISALKNDGCKKLIVIDNADHDDKIEQVPEDDDALSAITGWPNTTVIVTSRLEELSGYSFYDVDFLGEDECLDVFYLYYKGGRNPEDEGIVRQLIRLAKRHTFTVELIAKGGNRESSLSAYYDKLSDSFKNAKRKFKVAHHKEQDTITGHLKILFDIQQRTEDEISALWDFAVLPSDAELTNEEAEKWFKLDVDVLDTLVKDGWLMWKNRRFSMHPLVKEIIRFEKAPEATARHFLSFIEDYRNGYFDKGEVYTETLRKLSFAESVLDAVCSGKKSKQLGYILHNIGQAYKYLGQYLKALEYYTKALEIKESKLRKDHPSTATTYNNIAVVCDDMGDYPKALEYNEKALEIRENKLGKDHPDTATTYNNIAGVYKNMGDYTKALEYFKKALEISENKLGKDHPNTATTYNNIALVYDNMGDYQKAMEYHKKALEIRENKLGKDHPDTGTTYNNIAGVYKNMGDYQEALKYYEKALEISENKLGKDHPDTATTYNNIALVYNNMGDYEKALEYNEKALEIKENKLGKDHPNTATTYNNIAITYYNMEDYTNSEDYFLKALKVFLIKLGAKHPYTKGTLNSLFDCYTDSGKDEAQFKPWLLAQLNEDEQKEAMEMLETLIAQNS